MNKRFRQVSVVKGIFNGVFNGLVAGVISCTFGSGISAAPGNLPTVPLSASGATADPNIMLMFDSSNSMNAIVVDTPYDPSVNYFDCPDNKAIPDNKGAVIAYVQPDGWVYFKQDGNLYDFGKNNNNGTTGKPRHCFTSNKTYQARLFAEATTNAGDFISRKGGSKYTGNYLNWYFKNPNNNKGNNFGAGNRKKAEAKTRIEIVKEAGDTLVSGMQDVRMGFASFQSSQGNSPLKFGDNYVHSKNGQDGAKIHLTLGDIDNNTHRNAMKAAIASLNEQNTTYGTPLGEAFGDIGRYFVQGTENQTLILNPDTATPSKITASDLFSSKPIYFENNEIPTSSNKKNAIQYECQNNFIIGLTDGAPHSDGHNANNDSEDDLSSSLVTYANGGGANEILDDVTKALFDIDLRTDLPGKNNIRSYIIGFGDGIGRTALMDSAVALGGGESKIASNAQELATALKETIDAALGEPATVAAVAFNSQSLGADSAIFKVRYDPTDWSGKLEAYSLAEEDGDISTLQWDAGTKLNARVKNFATSKRFVLTHNGTDGELFNWTALTGISSSPSHISVNDLNFDSVTNAADGQGQQRLNYVLGDKSNEGSSPGKYRERKSVLGDIVNSAPVYVGSSAISWPDAAPFGVDGTRHSTFKNVTSKARTPVIYVGANDGMLHGFNASTQESYSGKEVLAYIPSQVFSERRNRGLHKLSDPDYGHRFYVDLTPSVSDVYLNNGSGDDWRTILVGGLRAGGKGYFALDITNPDEFITANKERIVLWEINENNDPHGPGDLGLSYSQPVVAMMNNNKWAVIFGNGYNSTNGKAILYIAYVEQGINGWITSDIVKIDTGVGTSTDQNGLSSTTVIDMTGDGIADRIYAGDLEGNLWAFDVTGSNDNKWSVAYSKSGKPSPLFAAVRSGVKQPITAAPLVASNLKVPEGSAPNTMIMFGTGQYLTAADITSQDVQSYYGVWDNGTSNIDRTDLSSRTLSVDSKTGARVLTGDPIDWSSSQGWYFDLAEGSNATGIAAERSVQKPILRQKALYFNTTIPDSAICSVGGDGWLMSVDFNNGLATETASLDSNNDGKIDNDTDTGFVGRKVAGLLSESAILGDYMYTNVGDKTLKDPLPPIPASGGRLGWQEIIPN